VDFFAVNKKTKNMSKYSQVDDTENNKLWLGLNRKFNKIVESDPATAKAKKELMELRAEVLSKNPLNVRQTESLTAKIDSFLAGEYGKTKTADNFGHVKPSK
jgi:2,3-bisphosphoglycerate-independent phosphoglycerate mutase